MIEVNPNDIIKKQRNLNASASIPSYIHIYSVTTEYIKRWFLSKFSDNFFKSININEKHVFDELRLFSKDELVKKEKPKLSITPMIDYEYDNDTLNQNQFGLDVIIQNGRLDRSFIKDYRHNLFIGMQIEELKFNYNFKMIFSTKSQQMNIAKYINMAFSIGNTKTYPIDLDFHIPYSIMYQLAKDIDNELVDSTKIKDIYKFLSYINSISELPILYKYNTNNGHNEFYIRMINSSIYIRKVNRLSIDEGEYEGMIKNDFSIEFDIEVLINGPKLYVYYSNTNQEHIELLGNISDSINMNNDDIIKFSVNMSEFPTIDSHGWTQYLTTQYEREENLEYIDFTQLFERFRLIDIIKYHNSISVSPNTFINILMKTENKNLYDFKIDWDTFIITFDKPINNSIIHIAMYMDTKFINDFNTTNNILNQNERIIDIEV